MQIHHDKHHQAYVNNANAALESTELGRQARRGGARNISVVPADKQGPVRNNAGGHANHTLFWRALARTAAASRPATWARRSTTRSADLMISSSR